MQKLSDDWKYIADWVQQVSQQSFDLADNIQFLEMCISNMTQQVFWFKVFLYTCGSSRTPVWTHPLKSLQRPLVKYHCKPLKSEFWEKALVSFICRCHLQQHQEVFECICSVSMCNSDYQSRMSPLDPSKGLLWGICEGSLQYGDGGQDTRNTFFEFCGVFWMAMQIM